MLFSRSRRPARRPPHPPTPTDPPAHRASLPILIGLALLLQAAVVESARCDGDAAPPAPDRVAPETFDDRVRAARDAMPELFRSFRGQVRDVEIPVLDALIEASRDRALPPAQALALWVALDLLAARAGPVARYQAQVKLDAVVAATIERADEAGLSDLVERLSGWVRDPEHPLTDSARDLLQVKVRCAAFALGSAPTRRSVEALLGESADTDPGGALEEPPLPAGRFDLASRADLFAVDARDSLVVAAGRSGTIRVSRDAGQSWSVAPPKTRSTLLDLAIGTGEKIWAVGTGGALVRSLDGAASWQTVSLPFRRNLLGVAPGTRERVFAAGDFGLLLRSDDGGASWTCVPQYADVVLNGLEPFGDGTFVYGEFGVIDRLDGEGFGLFPGTLTDGLQQPYIFDVWFSEDQSLGVAVGLRGLVLRSLDGGHHWEPVAFPFDVDLYAVDGHGRSVTVVGDAGLVSRSVDGGLVFERADAPVMPIPLTDVVHADANRVFAVGMGGTILRSEDAGRSFRRVASRGEARAGGRTE